MTTCMDLYLPRWYVLVAGKIDDAYSIRARPALRIGTTCMARRINYQERERFNVKASFSVVK